MIQHKHYIASNNTSSYVNLLLRKQNQTKILITFMILKNKLNAW